jgi:hypothetical protein
MYELKQSFRLNHVEHRTHSPISRVFHELEDLSVGDGFCGAIGGSSNDRHQSGAEHGPIPRLARSSHGRFARRQTREEELVLRIMASQSLYGATRCSLSTDLQQLSRGIQFSLSKTYPVELLV